MIEAPDATTQPALQPGEPEAVRDDRSMTFLEYMVSIAAFGAALLLALAR